MKSKAGGTGAAFNPTVRVENNTAPTDPADIAAYQARRKAEAKEQAQRNVDGAKAKVAKAKAHLAGAETPEKQERQRAHLKGAEEALATALAEQKGLD